VETNPPLVLFGQQRLFLLNSLTEVGRSEIAMASKNIKPRFPVRRKLPDRIRAGWNA
jgi:hypothetical protein